MADDDETQYFSFEERQKQKARSRERDEERLARGEISASDLQKENLAFRNLRFDKIGIQRRDGSGEWWWMSIARKSVMPVDTSEDD